MPSPGSQEYSVTTLLLTIGFSCLAIGMALSGFAFLGLQQQFGIGEGFAAAASSFLFAWWPVTADLLKYTGLVLHDPYRTGFLLPGPLFSAYVTLQTFGLIMVMVTMVLWVRALFAVRESSQQSSVTTNASALIGWACVFAAVLLLLDLAFRPFYSHVFSPAEFFIYFVLALFVEPATLLIVRLLYRVRRGTTERPTERQHGQRSTSKAAGYALQWIRR